eukprot:Rhum_TRINITY_DN14737_c22_g1::Rhum_TRINITY_DN14737_c22_g1_i1::g.113741::m.113741
MKDEEGRNVSRGEEQAASYPPSAPCGQNAVERTGKRCECECECVCVLSSLTKQQHREAFDDCAHQQPCMLQDKGDARHQNGCQNLEGGEHFGRGKDDQLQDEDTDQQSSQIHPVACNNVGHRPGTGCSRLLRRIFPGKAQRKRHDHKRDEHHDKSRGLLLGLPSFVGLRERGSRVHEAGTLAVPTPHAPCQLAVGYVLELRNLCAARRVDVQSLLLVLGRRRDGDRDWSLHHAPRRGFDALHACVSTVGNLNRLPAHQSRSLVCGKCAVPFAVVECEVHGRRVEGRRGFGGVDFAWLARHRLAAAPPAEGGALGLRGGSGGVQDQPVRRLRRRDERRHLRAGLQIENVVVCFAVVARRSTQVALRRRQAAAAAATTLGVGVGQHERQRRLGDGGRELERSAVEARVRDAEGILDRGAVAEQDLVRDADADALLEMLLHLQVRVGRVHPVDERGAAGLALLDHNLPHPPSSIPKLALSLRRGRRTRAFARRQIRHPRRAPLSRRVPRRDRLCCVASCLASAAATAAAAAAGTPPAPAPVPP